MEVYLLIVTHSILIEMKIVVNGQLINYVDEGQGKVVLLLHGWGANLKSFNDMAARLAKTYRVVRLDFPGFGESSLPPENWVLGDYAQLVKAILDKLKINTIEAVIAHSFGGRVTIKMHAEGHISARKIILVDSGGIKHSTSLRNQGFKAIAKVGKQVAKAPGLRKFHDTLRTKLYKSAGSMDYIEAGELQKVFITVINEDLREQAALLTQPCLLLWGENDTETPLSDAHIFHKKIKGSELVVIPNAGHFAYLDQPQQVMARIEAFLK